MSVCIINTGGFFEGVLNDQIEKLVSGGTLRCSLPLHKASLSPISFSIETVLPKFLAVVQRVSTHKRYSSMLPAFARIPLLATAVLFRIPWDQLSRISLLLRRILS